MPIPRHNGPMPSLNARPVRLLLMVALVCAFALQTFLLYAPNDDGAPLPPGADKVIHAGMFGGSALLAALLGWRWLIFALAIYAPTSEVLQNLVERDGDWRDAVADLTGILLFGVLVGWQVRRRVA